MIVGGKEEGARGRLALTEQRELLQSRLRQFILQECKEFEEVTTLRVTEVSIQEGGYLSNRNCYGSNPLTLGQVVWKVKVGVDL